MRLVLVRIKVTSGANKYGVIVAAYFYRLVRRHSPNEMTDAYASRTEFTANKVTPVAAHVTPNLLKEMDSGDTKSI